MGFWDQAGQFFGVGNNDTGSQYRNALAQNGMTQNALGVQLGTNYQQNQAGINNTAGILTGLATGANSVSAEQLRQGLQQSQAQQMSMAASANPANAAMAARTAMINSGGVASGMMGTQALAGLQERQNALNTLSQLQTTQAGQNINGAIGAFGASNQAYGTALTNKPKSWADAVMPGAGGAAAVIGAL